MNVGCVLKTKSPAATRIKKRSIVSAPIAAPHEKVRSGHSCDCIIHEVSIKQMRLAWKSLCIKSIFILELTKNSHHIWSRSLTTAKKHLVNSSNHLTVVKQIDIKCFKVAFHCKVYLSWLWHLLDGQQQTLDWQKRQHQHRSMTMMSLNFGQSSQLNLWSIDKKLLSAPTEQRFTTMPSLDFWSNLVNWICRQCW